MEHQVQQPPALLIEEQRGKTSVVYAAAKESRAHGYSESRTNGHPARAVYQAESRIELTWGV